MTSRLTILPRLPGLRAGYLGVLALLAAGGATSAIAQDSLAERASSALAEQTATPLPAIAGTPLTLRSEDAPAFTDTAGWAGRGGDLHYNEATRWLSHDRPSSMGLTLGVVSGAAAAGMPASPQAYDLGVRWRSRLEERVHLDVQAWTRNPWSQAAPDAMGMIWSRQPATIGTRLEVQWKASRTRGVVPEFGAIGVQLQGDAKLLLRARKGGPMVYYRAKF